MHSARPPPGSEPAQPSILARDAEIDLEGLILVQAGLRARPDTLAIVGVNSPEENR